MSKHKLKTTFKDEFTKSKQTPSRKPRRSCRIRSPYGNELLTIMKNAHETNAKHKLLSLEPQSFVRHGMPSMRKNEQCKRQNLTWLHSELTCLRHNRRLKLRKLQQTTLSPKPGMPFQIRSRTLFKKLKLPFSRLPESQKRLLAAFEHYLLLLRGTL